MAPTLEGVNRMAYNTIQQAAQAALDVQSACNLSGVARSFAEVMSLLRTLPECTGTEWANTHPVARLFAEQIAHLTMLNDQDGYSKAYGECERLAKGVQ